MNKKKPIVNNAIIIKTNLIFASQEFLIRTSPHEPLAYRTMPRVRVRVAVRDQKPLASEDELTSAKDIY